MEIQTQNKESTLAVNDPDFLEKQMRKAAGPEFIQALRLTYAVSEVFKSKLADIDDWMLGNSINLGKEVKIVIGPRRPTCMRLKDGNLDLISHNLTPNSVYNATTNDWEFPDGITPDFKEIMDKRIPDQGQKVINLIGYEHLFFLPDAQMFANYYLAKTAYTMTDLKDVFKNNKGRTAILSSKAASSKNNSWSIPCVRLTTDEIAFPTNEEAEEAIKKFLNPGIVYTPNTNERVR